ncbi:hypothetical protein LA6_004004 [Marinibacterium anthonyi]|nr:hypothetical protein LA6_004004 [Marinibacterium anthonyi]
MTRIAMIGSSHTAALRMAWDALRASDKPAEVSFFVAPGGIYNTLTMEDDHKFGLHGDDPAQAEARAMVEKLNGTLTINVSTHDHVVLVGQPFNSIDLLELLSQADVDGIRDTGADHLVSRPAFEALVGARVADMLPASWWRNRTDTQVTVVTRPRPSEGTLGNRRLAGLQRDPAGLGAALDWCSARARAEMEPMGIGLVDQPAITFADNGLTRAEFSRGSARLNDRAHGDDDKAHMNADFGALQWREILDVLGLQK